MTQWIAQNLGPDVPVHFTAFHPDWKMMAKPPTPPQTLKRAREIAIKNGIHFAYTGNIHDEAGGSTYCANCKKKIIGRDWYEMTAWNLDTTGACKFCGTSCPGVFEPHPGSWGAKRLPVRLADFD